MQNILGSKIVARTKVSNLIDVRACVTKMPIIALNTVRPAGVIVSCAPDEMFRTPAPSWCVEHFTVTVLHTIKCTRNKMYTLIPSRCVEHFTSVHFTVNTPTFTVIVTIHKMFGFCNARWNAFVTCSDSVAPQTASMQLLQLPICTLHR